jgi:hypothetical protein
MSVGRKKKLVVSLRNIELHFCRARPRTIKQYAKRYMCVARPSILDDDDDYVDGSRPEFPPMGPPFWTKTRGGARARLGSADSEELLDPRGTNCDSRDVVRTVRR